MLDEPIKSVAPELQIDGSTAATFELDGHKWTYDRKILAEEFEQSETGSSCPVCQITRFRRKFEIADSDYFIADCETCGLGRLLPSPTNEQISEFYEPAYYGVEGCKFSWLVEFGVRLVANRRAQFLARNFRQGGRILDVGCGRGVLISSLADLGFEVHGTEISATATQGADHRAEIRLVDSLEDAEYPDAYFDGIIIWHVLEHLPNPAETIQEAWRLLRPSGRLVVAVPNYSSLQAKLTEEHWFHLDPPRHLFHFPVSSLCSLIASANFKVQSTHHFSLRQNPFGWVQSILNMTGLFPRNQLYSLLQVNKSTDHPTVVRSTLLKAIYVLGMPLGLIASVLATILRRGATVHVVAEKQQASL